MKTTIKSIFVVMMIGLLSSPTQAQWKKNKIKGSGNVTTTNRTTKSYDKISAVGSITVILVAGEEGAITIKADDNLHEYVEVESNGDELTVKVQNNTNYASKNDIVVTVPFRDVSEVSITGSGDVIGKDTVKGDNLSLRVTGSGDLELTSDATTIDAKITGSGDMKLSGKTANLELKVTGSGDFMGYDLSAANSEVYVSGSGDAQVNATSSIKARVNGSGDIGYKGNPGKSDTKVMGSGSISSQ